MTAARSAAAANTDADAEAPTTTGTDRRLHPATEIIVLFSGLLLVFGIPSPVVPTGVIVASCCAAGLSTTVSLRSWAVGVAVVCLPTLLVLVLVQGFFYPGAEVRVLWEYGPAGLSVEGLSIAVQIWLRVTSLVGLCAVFGLGTDAARLFDGLRRLRLPVGAAYVGASVIGLIPLVAARTRQVIEARKARGWATDRWRVRVRLLPGIVVGLFTALLITVEQRHEVLEQSGLGATRTVVELQDHRDGAGQALMRVCVPVLVLGLLGASVAGGLPLPSASQLIGEA
jgi:energy-coupling factor transport system permease protein